MSLVFAESHAEFHYQYFKMVDVLMRHFEQNMRGLNLCAKPYVPLEQINIEHINKNKDEGSAEIEIRKEEKIDAELTKAQKRTTKLNAMIDRHMKEDFLETCPP